MKQWNQYRRWQFTASSQSVTRTGSHVPEAFCMLAFIAAVVLVHHFFRRGLTGQETKTELLMELENRLKLVEAAEKSARTELQNLCQYGSFYFRRSVMQRYSFCNEVARRARKASDDDLFIQFIYHYLPHLENHPNSTQPTIKQSKDKTGVPLVIGIPTVRRRTKSYLTPTVDSLLNGMSEDEMRNCLIVVCVTENDYAMEVIIELRNNFRRHFDSGLLEVISPSEEFYPSLDNLTLTFGDSLERVRWRTKQNLDYVYLMLYARSRGSYYMQLEDDVVATPGFVTKILDFTNDQKDNPWVVLEFSHLGFIGKLFPSKDLIFLVEFLLMFYKDKPGDWLLDHLIEIKSCSPEWDTERCNEAKLRRRIRFKPSLFQHIGKYSSLVGKVQLSQDKDFVGSVKYEAEASNRNPRANISTSLKWYQNFDLQQAYAGSLGNYFWALTPHEGDTITIKFTPPVLVHEYLFRSGHSEHPGDKFYNTSLEVLSVENARAARKLSMLKEEQSTGSARSSFVKVSDGNWIVLDEDGYVNVDRFNHETGVLGGKLDVSWGPIDSLRLKVLSDSISWAILSEILITEHHPLKTTKVN